ncbi:MAG: hypothetical protein DWI21_18345 [Planctomycetota bacterium]|nr:MAG: hypothetical protein DWI21_18345 [Planctomycetota bacterium]
MKIQAQWVRSGTGFVLGLGLLCGGFSATATAQGFRGGDRSSGFGGGGFPSPEDSFRRMDRNQNGQIDPDELGFMRDMYSRAGMDVSRPISQQEFIQGSQKIREQFTQARPSGGGGTPSFGGGPPSFGGGSPSFGGGPPSPGGGPPGSSDRRPDESSDRDSRRGDRDRRDDKEGDRRGDSSSSSKSSKKTAKPRVRVTKDLPADYRDKDKNGDGQIGLYEWDRKAFAQFFSLDGNGDGLLTADELIAATKKSTTKSTTTSGDSATMGIASSSGSRSPAPSDFGKPAAAPTPTPASPATPVEMTAGMKVFVGLDNDRDGTLTEEEWQRSRTARGKFEKAGIAVSFPIQQAQFVELYKQVEAK